MSGTSSDWENNVGGGEVVVQVEVEKDGDECYLNLSSIDIDLDLLIEDPTQAELFFESVAEAKRKWDGLR